MPHIQESHPEPYERLPMPKFDSKAENQVFELLSGEYPFEIVAVDNAISKGAKTAGCDVREVKLKFYKDKTFTTPLAQWTEDFIAYETSEWKWSLLAKCVGVELKDGEDFDITSAWIGRRGWAMCKPEEDKDKTKIDASTGRTRRYNRVFQFIVNKEKLAVNAAVTAEEKDDFPF
jgi:hypothetical protein